jgi:hypothetical protein
MKNDGRYYTSNDMELCRNKMFLSNMLRWGRGDVEIKIHSFSSSALDGMSAQLYISDAANVLVKLMASKRQKAGLA